MKKLILLPFFLMIFLSSNSQTYVRNNVYFELGGASPYYSINYERMLLNWANFNIAARVGVMYIKWDGDFYRGAPIGLSYLKSIGEKSYIEAGLFYTFIKVNEEHRKGNGDTTGLPNITYDEFFNQRLGFQAAYRHQPRTKGFFWNISFQLFATRENYEFINDPTLTPRLGLGLGYSF